MDSLRDRMPDSLLYNLLGLELWQWVCLAILVLFSMLMTGVASSVVGTITNRFGLKEKLTPTSVKGLKLAGNVIVLTLIWWLLPPIIELPDILTKLINFLVIFGAVLGGALLVCAAFDVALDASAARASELVSRADHILIPVARKLGRFIILIAAAVVFSASLGVNLAGVITGLGITGLLFALAAKDSVENIFGSITILFDMPFGIGDRIKTSNVEGVVEQINLRSTRIRTATDSLITLPNSNLIKASVENFGSRRYRPISLKLQIAFTNAPGKVKELVKKVRKLVEKNAKVRADNVFVHLSDLNGNAITVLVDCQLMTEDYSEEMELKEVLLMQILEVAAALEVALGPPLWLPLEEPVIAKKAEAEPNPAAPQAS